MSAAHELELELESELAGESSAIHELELESELSHEFEAELESGASGAHELELELEGEQELELAQELVHEFELEHEHEQEHEAFFNHLAAMADRTGRSQALRRVALTAARAALRSQSAKWPVVQGELELESNPELEFELESPATPPGQSLALMAHAGHAAAEAANEQEAAEHFLPLIGLAAKFVLPKLAGLAAKKLGGMALKKVGGKLIGRVGSQLIRRVAPRLIRRVTPQLTRGVANVTRTLFRNPSTRPLIHAVPRIARTTVARLGRQIASGRRITPATAVRTLAQQTARTLSNPRVLARTYRQSAAVDRRYHQANRRLLGRPSGPPVRAAGPGSLLAGISATPGVPTSAAPTASAPGFPWAAPAAPQGGCRCSQQAAPIPVPMAMPTLPQAPVAGVAGPMAAAHACPTCGR